MSGRGSVAHGGSLARTHEGAPGLPRGRSRLPADAVLAAQRDRLVRAMTAAVAAVGYPDVTVADVVRRARVSRTAFYAHFADKEECFLAATAHGSSLLFGTTLGAVAALPSHDDDVEMLRAGIRAFLGFLATEPSFARLFYVDLPGAGGRAQARLQAAYGRWGEINETWHQRARRRRPEWPAVPREAYLALAGATGELVRERVRAGRTDELPMLEDTLLSLHLAVLAGRPWPAGQAEPAASACQSSQEHRCPSVPGGLVPSSDFYAYPCDTSTTWDLPAAGAARFTWEYDDGRERLLALYQKGKDKQWDQTTRIDWSLDLDPQNPLGMPEQANPLLGSDMWRRAPQHVKDSWRQHQIAWQFSQFLHGEQGAMITSARIVESVPDLDAKFYAATQTMDEARHAETYERFLKEKVGMMYPINANLKALLDDTLSDSRWDMPYLGMQVLIEGLALAAFGLLRDMTPVALPKQIVAYVMQDEARHVAFGRLALKDYYAELSSAEKAEREEFVIQGCYLMRDRIRSVEVWENLGFDVDECLELTKASPYMQMFQSHLFSRIVPIVKDIGLWSEKVQAAYADMGVLDMAGVDLAKLMEDDENTAERLEREHRELLTRQREIDATIAVGAAELGELGETA